MSTLPGFKQLPHTGVIYVIERATEHGYKAHDANWSNLGQGAPEIGHIDGAPDRISHINIEPYNHEYGPITGQPCLREKVAELYNFLYRRGKKSQYTKDNVSISGGGRIALTRVVAALDNINLGHLLPDYTAYEELLSVFRAFIPIPILLNPEERYEVDVEQIKKEINGRGLKALLMSNPCNPTGQLLMGDKLKDMVALARDYQCSFIMDEFYSHYVYQPPRENGQPYIVSAAEFVDDVNHDPIIIIDGLTKNWRYPGWRISWTVGPKDIIQAVASAGSFLDGGANNPLQNESARLLEPDYMLQETRALQKCFLEKRNYALERLKKMGIQVEAEPQGTFYIWANLSNVPAPLNDGMKFFEAGLKQKVITVPGIFFDVNPGRRRSHSRFSQYCRISFGPEMKSLVQGLDGLEAVINSVKL
jgi:aspartate/methionine/tyrosine aminotransferase